jgi:hypothetical protein
MIDDQIRAIVEQVLDRQGLGTVGHTEDGRCLRCDGQLEENFDYLGAPNGYRGVHTPGRCIEVLRDRIEACEFATAKQVDS